MIFKHIEESSENLLRDNGFYKVGFDIDKLVKHLKIELIKKRFDFESDISGLLAINNNRAVISVNSTEDVKRQRFTIAHEIGHLTLHSKDQPFFVNKTSKVMYRNNASATGEIFKEREANAFAAALLMPRELISNEIDECEFGGDEAVKHLAKRFKVSEQAMSFRLSNLGYYIR
ncbi:MAG TPA: ImmA/IrrE family metallo-endopeptidase [Flavobacterium sp.]|uniref:ImmA/IrrE family metallo-endopeptidase n=1 Tax=Flavobacterium sp. TaxID=239 RepID=UPI002B4B28EA|nr:ImmA/IrrE family metallo-endopeptidase [Flavobacterium sp.]HLO73880.1 ImmA/IrrE family metallo-endopeptidase [Flavobacterium sp.]